LMGFVFAGAIVLLLRVIRPEQLLKVESLPDVTGFFATLQSPITPLLPSFWAGEALFATLNGGADWLHSSALWTTVIPVSAISNPEGARASVRGTPVTITADSCGRLSRRANTSSASSPLTPTACTVPEPSRTTRNATFPLPRRWCTQPRTSISWPTWRPMSSMRTTVKLLGVDTDDSSETGTRVARTTRLRRAQDRKKYADTRGEEGILDPRNAMGTLSAGVPACQGKASMRLNVSGFRSALAGTFLAAGLLVPAAGAVPIPSGAGPSAPTITHAPPPPAPVAMPTDPGDVQGWIAYRSANGVSALPAQATILFRMGVESQSRGDAETAVRQWRGAEEIDPGALAPRLALISHNFWQTRFSGSLDAVGATLMLDRLPSRVIGILPPELDDADVWEPHTLYSNWDAH